MPTMTTTRAGSLRGPLRLAVTLLASLLLLALGGCGSDSDEEDERADDPGTPVVAGDDPASLECEREGYACTWGEVDAAVGEASVELAEELDELTREGWDPEALAEVLEARDDVAFAQVGASAVRFRLEGGRPMWVLDENELVAQEAQAAGVDAGPADEVRLASTAVAGGEAATHRLAGHGATGSAASASPERLGAVVGDDHEAKSALVLSPYEWEGLHWAAEEVAGKLEETRGYEGAVTYLANEEEGDTDVTPAEFAGWDTHDVVFVATHGSQLCADGSCATILGLGIPAVEADPDHPDALAMLEDTGFADEPGVTLFHAGRTHVAMEGDWLVSEYAGGLDDTLVFVQACSSARAGDLATGLHGSNTVFFGWSNMALASDAGPAAEQLFGEMAERGIASADAYDELVDDEAHRSAGTFETEGEHMPGDTVYTMEDGELVAVEPDPVVDEYDAELERHAAPDDLRIREIVELRHPETGELLTDGDTVELGTSDDGEPTLPVMIEVDGVLDGQEADFEVSLRINGIAIPEPWTLADDEVDSVDEETYAVIDEVVLPGDVVDSELLELEATVALPEGGESRDEATVEPADLVMSVFAQLSVSAYGDVVWQQTLSGDVDLEPDEHGWSADPPPDWAEHEWLLDPPPGTPGEVGAISCAEEIDSTSDLQVPAVEIDGDNAVVDLRLDEAFDDTPPPSVQCPEGPPMEIFYPELELFVIASVVAGGAPVGQLEGFDPTTVVDVVGDSTVRLSDWDRDGDTLVHERRSSTSVEDGNAEGHVRVELHTGED